MNSDIPGVSIKTFSFFLIPSMHREMYVMAADSTKKKAPAFQLQDQDGKTVKLSDFQGRKVLVYFYPKADTPGCTKQACNIRDAWEELSTRGVSVLGISPDAPEKQKKFDGKHELNFPLLSDPDHKIAEAYGAWGEKSMYGKKYMGIIRSSFLLDEKGRFLESWIKVSPKDTVPNALKALDAG
jgi:peroxiredoxin Q/BCP